MRAARIRTTYDDVDNLGHVLRQTAHGQVELATGAAQDDAIVSHTEITPVGTWTWRTRETWIDGPLATQPLGHTEVMEFTDAGDPEWTRTHVYGIPALEFGADPPGEGGAMGYGTTTPTQTIEASIAHDAWGQPVAQCAGGNLGDAADLTTAPAQCLRFGTVTRDPAFGQLALTETAWIARVDDQLEGAELASAIDGATLETHGAWDRGLALLLSATAPNDETSSMRYDGFGRPVAALPPPIAGCPDGPNRLPTTTIRYELTPDPINQPLSRVRTTTHIRDASCAPAAPIEGIGYVDGLGRARAALATGDDEHAWVRSGITTFDQKGSVRRTYQPDFYSGSDGDFAAVVALPTDIPYAVTRYDAFGRARGVIAEDGSTVWTSHHAMSTDVCDPLDNDHSSPHYRTCTTARVDGHGRVVDQILRNRDPDTGGDEHYHLWSWYRQDGAVLALARTQRNASETRPVAVPTRDATTVIRTFTYDSVGRRWTSADPDTDSPTGQRWLYLFNRLGELAAVRDPRGCGQNFFYDLAGRLVGEQYVGCAEVTSTGDEQPIAELPAGVISLHPVAVNDAPIRVDVRYHYDGHEALTWVTAPGTAASPRGMPTGVEDRGQRSAIAYDRRGHAIWSARQMAFISNAAALVAQSSPTGTPRRTEVPLPGYVTYDEEHTYVRTATFDHAARPLSVTLPIDPDWHPDPANGVDPAPVVSGSLTYNLRGLPASATAHVGTASQPITAGIRYDRDGAVLSTTWGDERPDHLATVSEIRYDRRRRPIRFTTTRQPTGPEPLSGEDPSLAAVNTVVDQELAWDAASNVTDVVDHRDGNEWPTGFRPRTTHVDHDSLYRVVGGFFEYTQEDNRRTNDDVATDYRDTIDAIRAVGADPMATRPAEMLPAPASSRAVSLAWDYDFLGNSTEWSDDQDSFYERSLGDITNGLDIDARPSALYFATNIAAPLASPQGNAGWLELDYGAGGNVTAMTVRAQCGPRETQAVCTPGAGTDDLARRDSLRATCACAQEQHYEYRWDELNRITEARHWDRESGTWTLRVRQRYRYDGANQRTVKQTLFQTDQGAIEERIALYVLPGDFERRGLVRGQDLAYQPSSEGAETQYLVAGARLVWRHESGSHKARRLTVPLADLIQTTAATLDVMSGDLLEASTYHPNGARETVWADTHDPSALEPAGFTAKEADEEVGLTYFGERYLIARIGRWASPDPLHVHANGGGEALNSFHYVTGNLLQSRDPLGLDPPVMRGDNGSDDQVFTAGAAAEWQYRGVEETQPGNLALASETPDGGRIEVRENVEYSHDGHSYEGIAIAYRGASGESARFVQFASHYTQIHDPLMGWRHHDEVDARFRDAAFDRSGVTITQTSPRDGALFIDNGHADEAFVPENSPHLRVAGGGGMIHYDAPSHVGPLARTLDREIPEAADAIRSLAIYRTYVYAEGADPASDNPMAQVVWAVRTAYHRDGRTERSVEALWIAPSTDENSIGLSPRERALVERLSEAQPSQAEPEARGVVVADD
ncbi:Hypothetical protein I5071_69530 [Sandaracinus amylolyticus]|nr:Hypothetical protein I5071_69530 [Sandaracinus amylolyticus]